MMLFQVVCGSISCVGCKCGSFSLSCLFKKSFVTVHIQDDEHFTDGAGVALVSPLILNVHLCQLE